MYLLNFICLNEHIVTYFIWFVILALLCIFCNPSRVCILITDFCRGGNVNPPVIFFLLFNSPTVFVKYLLGVKLFVDILYIFVNGTFWAIFWALSEINKLTRDPSRAESVPHFVIFFHIYRCICQKLLFYWTYCHISYIFCYLHTLVHLLRPHRCSYLNYRALWREKR